MTATSYYDKLSIQLELETYIDSLSKSKKLLQELNIKRAFYRYFAQRDNDEQQFILDYLTTLDSEYSNSLCNVIRGFTSDSTNNVTKPITSDAPYNLGRLDNVKGIVVSSNGPIPPEIKRVIDAIKNAVEQSSNDDGWKPL